MLNERACLPSLVRQLDSNARNHCALSQLARAMGRRGSPLVEDFQFSTSLNNHPSTPSQTRLLQPITAPHAASPKFQIHFLSYLITTGDYEIYSSPQFQNLLCNVLLLNHPSHHKLPQPPHNHRTYLPYQATKYKTRTSLSIPETS